ncbi:hypothetical protein P8452_61818 [Trifolium repens]|nr:hypothetical protein P8452_61818 [Trifolium repens]
MYPHLILPRVIFSCNFNLFTDIGFQEKTQTSHATSCQTSQKALLQPSKLIDGRMTLCMLASDEVTRKSFILETYHHE